MTGGVGLPRLTKPQMARLASIGQHRVAWADHRPATTKALEALDLVDIAHPLPGENLRVVRLTILGIRVLAGLPGDEFDRFRATLAAQENPDADR